jgi:hypothetical protein
MNEMSLPIIREPTAHALAAFHTALIAGHSEVDAISAAIAAELREYRLNCQHWQERLLQTGIVLLTPPTDQNAIETTRLILAASATPGSRKKTRAAAGFEAG